MARLENGINLDRETVETLRDLAERRDVPFILEPVMQEPKGASM